MKCYPLWKLTFLLRQWKHFKSFTCLWYFKIKSRTWFTSRNAMIKTKLILNLGNKSESRQDWKIVGDVEGGLRISLHMSHSEVPKESSLSSVKALMLWEPVKPLWKGSNQWLISNGLIQLIYFSWSLSWSWLKNIIWVLLRSRNSVVTTVFKVQSVVGITYVVSVLSLVIT